jgi:hypothetical protein
MKNSLTRVLRFRWAGFPLPGLPLPGILLCGLIAHGAAQAQSVCASDGVPRPARLVERFINADCENCWRSAATPKTGRGELPLDWVVPGAKGDDAPLSAVATRDALSRLESLRSTAPATSSVTTHAVGRMNGANLRVARGLPLGGYMGASIALKPVPSAARGQQWTAWLALVETLPAGAEGSPVERNLVRNVFQASWDGRKQLSKTEQKQFFDQRSMSVAEGVDPGRLRVVGWLENGRGKVMTAAVSRCAAEKS